MIDIKPLFLSGGFKLGISKKNSASNDVQTSSSKSNRDKSRSRQDTFGYSDLEKKQYMSSDQSSLLNTGGAHSGEGSKLLSHHKLSVNESKPYGDVSSYL